MDSSLFKRTILIGLSLFLTACGVQTNTVKARFDMAVEEAVNQELSKFTTMNRDLFSYYLPLSIGRRNSTPTSALLISHNEEILMNLDIISVLNAVYYTDESENVLRSTVNVNNAFYANQGTFNNYKGIPIDYQVSVNALNEKTVLLTLETETFIFSSIHPIAISPEILFDMMTIARTSTVNKNEVVAAFSNREIIDYQKETLNMFSQLAPESGTVIDMVEGDEHILLDEEYYDGGQIEEIPDQSIIE